MGLHCNDKEQLVTESIAGEIYDQNADQMVITNTENSSSNEGQSDDHLSIDTTDKNSAEEDAYNEWKMRHPSALNKFDKMMSIAKEKKLVVFLDYDGTLSPIVDDPDRAFMSDSMRSAVSKVAQYFPTCIVSGRRRDKVYDFVRLNELYYVGSHGMDIMAPLKCSKNASSSFHEKAIDENGNEVVVFQPAQEFLPIIEEIFDELEEQTKEIPGIMIENNKFCVSVHFRRVDEEYWGVLEEQVVEIANKYPSLHLTRGRKVIEIRPSIKWDKGRALEYLLDTLGFANDGDAIPVYIGDDRTDEDAFKVLRNRGEGYPIIVSSIPKDTKASYSLRDPSEVMSFLSLLFKWKRSSSVDWE
ncbi:probable trehalose-phosphate phosphatase 6 [Dioscorea cayenensis subsp. rotundata]|uniref:Trehalose 6-phosphate phosphatase n=1 Tax=Dioscorea cayennensis subsp. rotundata TaxID=55577 RepID=A0AB40BC44_DIOCR|nr:probable trehalose-phosphate phosphatase 6 [Dioscorea cayenensis subsp. rotundata]